MAICVPRWNVTCLVSFMLASIEHGYTREHLICSGHRSRDGSREPSGSVEYPGFGLRLGVGQLQDAANCRCCVPKDDPVTRHLAGPDEQVDRAAVQEGELRHVENDRCSRNHHFVDLVLEILDGPDVELAP